MYIIFGSINRPIHSSQKWRTNLSQPQPLIQKENFRPLSDKIFRLQGV